MKITVPGNVDIHALACLQALQKSSAGRFVVLGGAFGLFHYHEYRKTKDVDAWWSENAAHNDEREAVDTIEKALQKFGEVRTKGFGDVISVNLMKDSKIIFSFQIARRSVVLEEPDESPWKPILLDSLKDLIASKMAALIQRGIPRDFMDIHEICIHEIATVSECWNWWREREKKRGVSEVVFGEAREAVLLHLNRIERMRPLDSIKEDQERDRAFGVRRWFKDLFCGVLNGLD